MLQPRKFLPLFATGLAITATAFEVPFSDVDYNSQTCTGMWGGSVPFINGMQHYSLRNYPDNVS